MIHPDVYRPMAAAIEKQQRFQAMLDAHQAELMLGLMLLERMRTYLVDPRVEWLVPEAWGWGDAGETGELYGIPFRVVAGVDVLFLAQEVKPGA